MTVVAEPGSGKTALLAEFAASFEGPVAWFSVAAGDRDIGAFFARVASLLARVIPDLSLQALDLARSLGADGLAHASGVLADDLAQVVEQPTLLVVDQCERLPASTAAVALLETLLAFRPPALRIALAGRSLPPLPLARYRLGGESIDLGDADLRFAPQDIPALVAAFGAGSEADRAGEIFQRTHGWAAGLVFALRSGSSGCRALDRLSELHAYFDQEVFPRLPESLRDPLLECSFLPLLEPAACRGLLDARAARFLDHLPDLPFTVSVGDRFALMPLFQEYLQARARRHFPASAWADLCARLSERAAGSDEAAIHWLIEGGRWEEAEARLLAAAPRLFREGRAEAVEALVESFPAGLAARGVALAYLRGECARRSGDLARALDLLDHALHGAETTAPSALTGRIEAALAAVHGARGDTVKQRSYAELALSVLGESPDAGDADARAACLNVLGMYHVYRNEVAEARERLNAALGMYRDAEDAQGEGRVLHNLGLASAKDGDFSGAISCYREAIRRLESAGHLPLPLTFGNLALCLHYRGQQEEAWRELERGLAVADRLGARRDRTFLLLALGRLHLDQGEAARARECFDEALDAATATGNRLARVNAHVAIAEWHVREGDVNAARLSVDQALAAGGTDLSDPAMLEGLLALAEADLRGGDLDAADRHLAQARTSLAAAPHPYAALHVARLDHLAASARADETRAARAAAAAQALCGQYGFSPVVHSGQSAASEGPPAIAHAIAPALEVTLMGSFTATVDGQELPARSWRSSNSRLVLAYLLLTSRGAPKEKLVELLYPDESPAASALHVVINRLRQALEPDLPRGKPSRFVLFQDGRYFLGPGLHIRHDVSEFRQLALHAQRADLPPRDRADVWDRALAHYQGPFLEAFPDVEWCRIERERLRRIALAGYEQRFGLAAASDDWVSLESKADALLHLEPGEDLAFRAKLVALAMQERTGDALRLAPIAAEAVRRATGAELAEETTGIIDRLRAGNLTVRAAREALVSPW
jgi:LuxR family maltose regulon positive regulatory protein